MPAANAHPAPDLHVLSIGEALIDLVPQRDLPHGYLALPGGAPANVAVGVCRLGGRAGFAGAVGRDAWGDFLAGTLAQEGVDVSGLVRVPAPTTLAVVSSDPAQPRYAFYRGADAELDVSHLSDRLLARGRFVHVGSVTLSAQPARAATLHAARRARALGRLVSVDLNLRPALWPRPERMVPTALLLVREAHLLKVNLEELQALTGLRDPLEGARRLQAEGPVVVLVTGGSDGAWFVGAGTEGHVPAPRVPLVDSTGAGDAFTAAVLTRLAVLPFPPDPDRLAAAVRFAVRAASVSVTRVGAIPSLPTLADVGASPPPPPAHLDADGPGAGEQAAPPPDTTPVGSP